MTIQANIEATPLNAYESAQVARVAEWKGEHPPVIAELFRKFADPIAHVAERIIPDSVARAAIRRAYQAAEASAGRDDVARRAGVADIAELRHRPLEDCDRLARQIGRRADALGAAEGALTGAGGALTTLIDIPLLFTLALRTILRIGYCYGYPLDRRTDHAYVLGILVAALADSRERKQHLLVRLREIEDLLLEEAQESMVEEELASFLFQLEIFADLPGVGLVSGAALNFGTIHRCEQAARHVFQERWLHDHGKVGRIAPAAERRRLPVHGNWAGVVGRAAYHGGYYVGFGAAFAFYTAARLVPPGSALARGIHDGAHAAAGDADRATVALRGALTSSRDTAAAAVPA